MITIHYSEIFNFLVSCIGYLLIYIAIDTNRPNDKIKSYSKQWWINLSLVVVASLIIRNVDKWFP